MRDENGRFRPGCAPGPGRPKRSVEIDFLRRLADASEARWDEIVSTAIDQAAAGDAAARQWLAKYLIGEVRPGELARIAAAESRGRDPAADRVAGEVADREIAESLLDAIRCDHEKSE